MADDHVDFMRGRQKCHDGILMACVAQIIVVYFEDAISDV
jgi:hypothetical protein